MMLNLSGYGTLTIHRTLHDTRPFFNEDICIYIRVILKLLLILAADPHMWCTLIVAKAASPASSCVINLILFNIMTQNLKGLF